MHFVFLPFLSCLQLDQAFLEHALDLHCKAILKVWHSEITAEEMQPLRCGYSYSWVPGGSPSDGIFPTFPDWSVKRGRIQSLSLQAVASSFPGGLLFLIDTISCAWLKGNPLISIYLVIFNNNLEYIEERMFGEGDKSILTSILLKRSYCNSLPMLDTILESL